MIHLPYECEEHLSELTDLPDKNSCKMPRDQETAGENYPLGVGGHGLEHLDLPEEPTPSLAIRGTSDLTAETFRKNGVGGGGPLQTVLTLGQSATVRIFIPPRPPRSRKSAPCRRPGHSG